MPTPIEILGAIADILDEGEDFQEQINMITDLIVNSKVLEC